MDATAPRRVFVGLAPDVDVAQELHAAAARVLDPSGWRVHAASEIHLTLCFLGEIGAAALPRLEALLAPALAELPAPALLIAGTGAFPDRGRARALWAGVDGAPAELERLGALRRAGGSAIRACGLDWDEGTVFRPHLTLARPRGKARVPEAFLGLAFARAWRPSEVFVFESTGAAGERYPRRSVAPLGPG